MSTSLPDDAVAYKSFMANLPFPVCIFLGHSINGGTVCCTITSLQSVAIDGKDAYFSISLKTKSFVFEKLDTSRTVEIYALKENSEDLAKEASKNHLLQIKDECGLPVLRGNVVEILEVSSSSLLVLKLETVSNLLHESRTLLYLRRSFTYL